MHHVILSDGSAGCARPEAVRAREVDQSGAGGEHGGFEVYHADERGVGDRRVDADVPHGGFTLDVDFGGGTTKVRSQAAREADIVVVLEHLGLARILVMLSSLMKSSTVEF